MAIVAPQPEAWLVVNCQDAPHNFVREQQRLEAHYSTVKIVCAAHAAPVRHAKNPPSAPANKIPLVHVYPTFRVTPSNKAFAKKIETVEYKNIHDLAGPQVYESEEDGSPPAPADRRERGVSRASSRLGGRRIKDFKARLGYNRPPPLQAPPEQVSPPPPPPPQASSSAGSSVMRARIVTPIQDAIKAAVAGVARWSPKSKD